MVRMASSPITSWEVDGETVETVSDFVFWGSKITTDGDCSDFGLGNGRFLFVCFLLAIKTFIFNSDKC